MVTLLTKDAVAKLVGYHPVHIMRLVDAGQFPAPIKLGPTKNAAIRFVAEEIETWLAARMAERQHRRDWTFNHTASNAAEAAA